MYFSFDVTSMRNKPWHFRRLWWNDSRTHRSRAGWSTSGSRTWASCTEANILQPLSCPTSSRSSTDCCSLGQPKLRKNSTSNPVSTSRSSTVPSFSWSISSAPSSTSQSTEPIRASSRYTHSSRCTLKFTTSTYRGYTTFERFFF